MMRLANFDYAIPGAYFVTICTQDRRSLFGEIQAGEMRLNNFGQMIRSRLVASSDMCQEIEIDEYIIMPDHIHFIIFIVGAHAMRPDLNYANPTYPKSPHPDSMCNDSTCSRPNRGAWHAPLRKSKSVSSFVGLFKSKTTSIFRKMLGDEYLKLWQRNYYDRIIRNETELHAIRKYIQDNPLQWELDPEYQKENRLTQGAPE